MFFLSNSFGSSNADDTYENAMEVQLILGERRNYKMEINYITINSFLAL